MESKDLPKISINQTDFIVDVYNLQLQERENPKNCMSFKDMDYVENNREYHFLYDSTLRNFPDSNPLFDGVPVNSVLSITIPELSILDPYGMAEKYHLPLQEVQKKTDLDLSIVKGSATDLRWNKGILPILNIAGHTFFVDMISGKLRPKDDFKSKGIDFREIREYYDKERASFVIPYNAVTRQFQEIDPFTLRELPKDLLMIEFPTLHKMDTLGYLKKEGLFLHPFREHKELKMTYDARILPWEETNVIEHIKRNVAEQLLPLRASSLKIQKDGLKRIPTDLERKLPVLNIYGTNFLVDVNQLQLIESGNPQNTISLTAMQEQPMEGYEFNYSPISKNICSNLSSDSKHVRIDDFVKLDPTGMSKKYMVSRDKLEHLTDFDLLVKQSLYRKAVKRNFFPTIDISGAKFYVDMSEAMLLPQSDIWSRGINFNELQYYYSQKDHSYIIPYNTKTKSFEEISLNAKEIPKDLIVVQIPHEDMLHPVWRNQKNNVDPYKGLKLNGLQEHFIAKVIPWNNTRFEQSVRENNNTQTKSENKAPTLITKNIRKPKR